MDNSRILLIILFACASICKIADMQASEPASSSEKELASMSWDDAVNELKKQYHIVDCNDCNVAAGKRTHIFVQQECSEDFCQMINYQIACILIGCKHVYLSALDFVNDELLKFTPSVHALFLRALEEKRIALIEQARFFIVYTIPAGEKYAHLLALWKLQKELNPQVFVPNPYVIGMLLGYNFEDIKFFFENSFFNADYYGIDVNISNFSTIRDTLEQQGKKVLETASYDFWPEQAKQEFETWEKMEKPLKPGQETFLQEFAQKKQAAEAWLAYYSQYDIKDLRGMILQVNKELVKKLTFQLFQDALQEKIDNLIPGMLQIEAIIGIIKK